MDRFERVLTLLRRGQAAEAGRLRAETPAAWLPRWTAGDPLSRALVWSAALGSMITAVQLDDTYVWAMCGETVQRVRRSDGEVSPLHLEGPAKFRPAATFVRETVVAVEDERLLVWDLAHGKLLLATDPDDIPRRAGGLTSLAVGAGVAVTGTEGGYLLQWDLSDGRLLARTAAHDGYVARVAISTEGPPAVLSLSDEDRGTVSFHDLDGLRPAGQATAPQQDRGGGWTMVDGHRRAVTVGEDGLLTVWDPTTVTAVAQFATGTSPRGVMAFTADGGSAVLTDSPSLHVVDLRDGTVRGTVRTGIRGTFSSVATEGLSAVVSEGFSTYGHLSLFDLTDPLPQDGTEQLTFGTAAATTIDGRAVTVAVNGEGPYRVYDADGQECAPAGRLPVFGGPPQLRTVTAAGRELVVSFTGLELATVDPATGEIRSERQPIRSGYGMSRMTTGAGLIAAVVGDWLGVWDAATLDRLAEATMIDAQPTISVALGELAGRPVLLLGAVDGGIRWYDSANLSEIAPPGLFAERVGPDDFVVDQLNWPGPHAVTALEVAGTVVVSAVGDTVTCADIASGEPLGPPLVHPGQIGAVHLTAHEGRTVVATSGADQVLRIWDVTTGATTWAEPLPCPARRLLSVTPDQVTYLDDGFVVAMRPGPPQPRR